MNQVYALEWSWLPVVGVAGYGIYLAREDVGALNLGSKSLGAAQSRREGWQALSELTDQAVLRVKSGYRYPRGSRPIMARQVIL